MTCCSYCQEIESAPLQRMKEQSGIISGRLPSWFENSVGHQNIRFFSYARYALAEGLGLAGIKKSDKVLFPEFICRDILSSANSLGAVPVFYPVDAMLRLAVAPDDLPAARAIVAVNYFGFPQDLGPYREYCRRTGALLVEDNAHGLLGRDEKGLLLGTRGDFGIFSLRKTIFVPDGAALVVNNPEKCLELLPQLECSSGPAPLSFRIKKFLRNLAPVAGTLPLSILTSLIRYARKVRCGREIPQSSPDAERVLPGLPNPCKDFFSYLSAVDIQKEVHRRRGLYMKIEDLLKGLKLQPVFDTLPLSAVPYGYPFYAEEYRIREVRALLRKYGLECFSWPDLPDSVRLSAPDYYKTIRLVNFL